MYSSFVTELAGLLCKTGCWFYVFSENRRVDGETRVGIFAAQDIRVGESLTYDYRYATQGIIW